MPTSGLYRILHSYQLLSQSFQKSSREQISPHCFTLVTNTQHVFSTGERQRLKDKLGLRTQPQQGHTYTHEGENRNPAQLSSEWQTGATVGSRPSAPLSASWNTGVLELLSLHPGPNSNLTMGLEPHSVDHCPPFCPQALPCQCLEGLARPLGLL